MSCCFSDEKACHSSAENDSTVSSQTALTVAFPSEEKSASNVEMSVEQILSEGYRTSDISTNNSNVVDTQKIGDLIAMRI